MKGCKIFSTTLQLLTARHNGYPRSEQNAAIIKTWVSGKSQRIELFDVVRER